MAFQSYFDQLPFNGSFDNGMPVFPFGGAYGGIQQNNQPGPVQAQTMATAPQSGGGPSPAVVGGTGTISGFGGSGIDGTSPTLGGPSRDYGDAQFAAMGFNPPTPGGSYGQGTSSNFVAPDIWGSISGKVSDKADTIGNNFNSFIDRISSVGNSPHFNNDNLAQTGINLAGFASPFVPMLAGIAQGFNLFDPTSNTGNAATNLMANPGIIQSGSADIANWINRQFGGNYMPYDAGSHAAQEPGAQSALQGMSGNIPQNIVDSFNSAAQEPGNISDPRNYGYNSDFPVPGTGEFYGGGDFIGTGATPYNPYSMSGNMAANFMQGAAFGGGRWDTTLQPDNNGGWGQ